MLKACSICQKQMRTKAKKTSNSLQTGILKGHPRVPFSVSAPVCVSRDIAIVAMCAGRYTGGKSTEQEQSHDHKSA